MSFLTIRVHCRSILTQIAINGQSRAQGCLGLFRRQVYLDIALRGKEVTCYKTVEGLEVRGSKYWVSLLREYRRWQNQYWRQELPEDLRFEPYTPLVCPWIAVA